MALIRQQRYVPIENGAGPKLLYIRPFAIEPLEHRRDMHQGPDNAIDLVPQAPPFDGTAKGRREYQPRPARLLLRGCFRTDRGSEEDTGAGGASSSRARSSTTWIMGNFPSL